MSVPPRALTTRFGGHSDRLGPTSDAQLCVDVVEVLAHGPDRDRLDPVAVSKQLGHANPGITLRVYSHEFDKARHTDELRLVMSNAFGHMLAAADDAS